MPAGPSATVVVVARDRWSQAPRSLETLLARTDRSVPVVIVDGAAPPAVGGAFDRLARSDRFSVVRRNRFLASNEARNLGADGLRTEWVAFVENDTTLSDGWLDRLIEVGETRDAVSVFPAYLDGPDGETVHGLGAEVTVTGADGSQLFDEHQHHLNERWEQIGPTLTPIARVQSEPHAVVIRRSFLEELGGLDEGLLSWFDHIDLGLHHRRLGASSWLVPDVTCIYTPPPPVTLTDLSFFALRWGREWYQTSLSHLCRVWGFDLANPSWADHQRYREGVRSRVPTRWLKFNRGVAGLSAPLEWALAKRWERQLCRESTDGGAV